MTALANLSIKPVLDPVLAPAVEPALEPSRVRSAWLLPYAVLGLFAAAILALLWFVHRHESEIDLNNLRRDTQLAELALTRKLLAHQEFASRLAGALSAGQTPETLTDQAEVYLRENPELLNAIWTREDGVMSWVAPGYKEPVALSRERPEPAERERMMRLTRATGRATYTEPYRDYQNEPYIEYHSPIIERGNFHGTVSATISLRAVMLRLIPPAITEKYRVALLDAEGRELFRLEDRRETYELLTQTVQLTLPWRNLHLSVTSYKTDSLIGRAILTALALALTGVLVWSLALLRRRVQQQMAADAALVASHERFVTVLDSLEAAVYVTDFSTGEVLFVNDNFKQVFPGFGTGAMASSVESALVPAPSASVPAQRLLDTAGRPSGVEVAEVRDGRTGAWFLLRAKAIRWVDGRIVRMHMVSDITARKHEAEKSRVQQEKLLLTQRLMSVGEMAATLAHEINQPLSAIANYNMGCVRRLKSGEWDRNELLAAMEKSSAQAERAGRVVRRVREFLRRREPQREPCDINAVIDDVAGLIELEAEQAGVTIIRALEPGLPLVNADHIMAEQVLLNLIKNGIDAMQHTPAPQRVLTITTRRAGAAVEISVSDNGCGIAASVEAELFSPFFTTKENGMGMGLNICRSIVEMHEGRLWFTRGADGGVNTSSSGDNSSANGGSAFHFTLPLASGASA